MNIHDISQEIGRIISQMDDRVVQVRTRRRTATGFAVDNGGIVTAAHALRKGGDIHVVRTDGTERPARVVGRDFRYDLALLEVDIELEQPAFSDGEELQVGHLVFPLGRPGKTLRAAFGMVSALGGAFRLHGGGELSRFIETDGSLPSGFSGGPLIDGRGRVLGMNSSLPRGTGMTVPMTDIRGAVKRIRESGDVTRGYLGVNSVPVPVAMKDIPGVRSGLMITEVEAGSPADSAGILQGDVLYELAGAPMGDITDLVNVLSSGIAGKVTAAKVLRSGETTELNITPASGESRESRVDG